MAAAILAWGSYGLLGVGIGRRAIAVIYMFVPMREHNLLVQEALSSPESESSHRVSPAPPTAVERLSTPTNRSIRNLNRQKKMYERSDFLILFDPVLVDFFVQTHRVLDV